MTPEELLNSWLGGKWDQIVVPGGELRSLLPENGYRTGPIYICSSGNWIEIGIREPEDEYDWDAEFSLYIGIAEAPPIPELDLRWRPPRKLLEDHPDGCPVNDLCTDGIKKIFTFGLERDGDQIVAGSSLTVESKTGHRFGFISREPPGDIEIKLLDAENENGWPMEVDDFAYNPIIDELIWVRETMGPVTKLVPEIESPADCAVRFIGPNSLMYRSLFEPGTMAGHWAAAVTVLAYEGCVDSLRDLEDRERATLAPAEEDARQYWEERNQERKADAERSQLTRAIEEAIEEANEAFRLKQYELVVSILAQHEDVIDGVPLRKLTYARERL